MASRLNPYLNLNGTARQALEFYQGVFGGELNIMTFGDMGAADASDAGKIMHGQLETSAGYTLMVADVPSHMEYQAPAGFSVSLSGDDGDALRGYFEQLAAGGVTADAAAEAGLGRRVRHVRRQVRHLLAGQHLPAAGVSQPGRRLRATTVTGRRGPGA